MRSEQEILSLIKDIAGSDPRIRAVLLNGSRANDKIIPDPYQDFDIVFLVNDLTSFEADPDWVDVFGERIIMQMPDSMEIVDEPQDGSTDQITYLMLFTDTNRIDLKLKGIKKQELPVDSLTKVLVDKDELFPKDLKSGDEDYWIKKPTQKQFSECCNEFWWVSTYVMKGLLRQEEMYAKEMLEKPVRDMFLLMLSWKVGTENNFSINLGSSFKFLKKYIEPNLWERILRTYPNAELSNILDSLMEMADIFHATAIIVAEELGYIYYLKEAQQVREYLEERRKELL